MEHLSGTRTRNSEEASALKVQNLKHITVYANNLNYGFLVCRILLSCGRSGIRLELSVAEAGAERDYYDPLSRARQACIPCFVPTYYKIKIRRKGEHEPEAITLFR